MTKKTVVTATLILGIPGSNLTAPAQKLLTAKKAGRVIADNPQAEIQEALANGESFILNLPLSRRADRLNTIAFIKEAAVAAGIEVDINGVVLDTRVWVANHLLAQHGQAMNSRVLRNLRYKLTKKTPPSEADGFTKLATIVVDTL